MQQASPPTHAHVHAHRHARKHRFVHRPCLRRLRWHCYRTPHRNDSVGIAEAKMDECDEQADNDAVLRAAVPAEEGTAQHAAALSAHAGRAHAAARKAAKSNHIPISSVYNHASMICDGVASFIQPIMATGGKVARGALPVRFRRSCCWPCLGIDFGRALAEADRRNSGRCHWHWHARPSQGAPSPASLSTVAGRALQLGLRVFAGELEPARGPGCHPPGPPGT